MSEETPRGPEGAPSPSPRELAAAAAIQAIEAKDRESDPDYPALTTHGALRLATAAIAAAQVVDIENGIVRIRRSELQKTSPQVTTTDQLAAIQARADAATEGPWELESYAGVICLAAAPNGNLVVDFSTWTDGEYTDKDEVEALASFIAHARTDVPALLAMVRELQAALDAVMATADINMDSEHGDPAFISGWQAALEEVRTRITEAMEERPVSGTPITLLEDTDPATVFDVRLSVADAVDVIEDGLRNDSMEDLNTLAFNIYGLLIDASRAAITATEGA